jgi:hypothetical protein
MLLSLVPNPPIPVMAPSKDSNQANPVVPKPPTIILPTNVTLHNAGNDAYMTLWALQVFLEPTNVETPVVLMKRHSNGHMFAAGFMRPSGPNPLISGHITGNAAMAERVPMVPFPSMVPGYMPMTIMPMTVNSTNRHLFARDDDASKRHSSYDLAGELGKLATHSRATRSRSGPIETIAALGLSKVGSAVEDDDSRKRRDRRSG